MIHSQHFTSVYWFIVCGHSLYCNTQRQRNCCKFALEGKTAREKMSKVEVELPKPWIESICCLSSLNALSIDRWQTTCRRVPPDNVRRCQTLSACSLSASQLRREKKEKAIRERSDFVRGSECLKIDLSQIKSCGALGTNDVSQRLVGSQRDSERLT